MAILVAGGAGYIGSHTCVELLNRGFEVVVVDNLYNSSEVALERVQQITGKTLKFYKGDLLNREDLEPIFEKEEIEAVINFAGLKAVGESVAKPWEYYHNNITGTLILCDVMRKHGCKNMIFSSSATVYGDPAEIPITENCPKGEITNPYGQTKGMLEQILTDLHVGDPEWNIMLLRYFNPIGAHESGLIGEDPKGNSEQPGSVHCTGCSRQAEMSRRIRRRLRHSGRNRCERLHPCSRSGCRTCESDRENAYEQGCAYL